MLVDKKNIILKDTIQSLPYISGSKRSGTKFPTRMNTFSHARLIASKLDYCYASSEEQRQVAAIRYKDGVYLEFSSAEGYDLATKSLEAKQQGIRLLNIREEQNTTKAVVYIPKGKENYFLKKVNAYATEVSPKSGKPKNNDLVSSVEDVKLALLDSFWFGKHEDMPNDIPLWCEIWLRYYDDYEQVIAAFSQNCEELNVEIDSKRIVFPERVVVLIKASRQNLTDLISVSEFLAEIRRAPEPVGFFDGLSGQEQSQVVNEILSRARFNDSDTSICILDTGIAAGHPLISPVIESDDVVQSVNSSWGANDHQGHGTEMAGVAVYNNLTDIFLKNEEFEVNHKIESVKILPPRGNNPKELYGAITEQAVSLAEIERPNRNRVICMAVTTDEFYDKDGSPTSWSAAVDNITSGANTDGEDKRLFFISAGNISPHQLADAEYPDINVLESVKNPAQSWNAITVGCYTNNVSIQDPRLNGYTPVADVEQLSPYSTTSVTWDNKWPIKPEILLDGGNVATNGDDYTEADDLSLLTTSKNFLSKPLSTIWGTSSATAQASWMAAQIYSVYPELWPETVRALLIHSARWTDKMREQFIGDDKKLTGRRNLLRTCGYGIPDLQRAVQCYKNSVNLVVESEIQPFDGEKMNEMHLHTLPWPKEVLEALGDTDVTLRITLSYFIEPGPGEIGWKDKYRYASCGLRFDVINSNETVEDFKKRINVKMRDEKNDSGDGSSRDWFLGTKTRDVGSIHSDFCQSTAIDLADANRIAVYPVIGWWRERRYLGKSNQKIRYSLIVSLETPDVEADIYNPIITQIANEVVI